MEAGLLTFCECGAGHAYRRHLLKARKRFPEPEVVLGITRQDVAERRRKQLFESAGVPGKYLPYTIDSFMALAGQDLDKREAVEKVHEYLQDGGVVVNGRPKVGLFLHGDPGVGKTGLLSPLFLHYLHEGYSGLWVQYNELMAAARDFESGKVANRIEACKTVDYLFIDDFGDPGSTRIATDYARDVMFRIVDHRNNRFLPIFITSNLDLDALGDQFHVRLSRRLADNCAVVKMGGRAL